MREGTRHDTVRKGTCHDTVREGTRHDTVREGTRHDTVREGTRHDTVREGTPVQEKDQADQRDLPPILIRRYIADKPSQCCYPPTHCYIQY